MKLFAAGPEPAELQRCVEDGLCEGVVVLGVDVWDPSTEARARLVALGAACAGPILVEVGVSGRASASGPPSPPPASDAALDVPALARALAALGPRFAARIPFAAGGAATFEACKAAGVATNASACATADEALAAGRAGATWVSPALTGPRGSAVGADYDTLRKTRGLLKAFELPTALLFGPLRDAGALFDSTMMGAHVALASPAVLRELAARRSHAGPRS